MQDFFIFEHTVHLYRENSKKNLYQRKDENHMTYSMQKIRSTLSFTWSGYLINGVEITSNQSIKIREMNFKTFTFISPVVDIIFLQIYFRRIQKKVLTGFF